MLRSGALPAWFQLTLNLAQLQVSNLILLFSKLGRQEKEGRQEAWQGGEMHPSGTLYRVLGSEASNPVSNLTLVPSGTVTLLPAPLPQAILTSGSPSGPAPPWPRPPVAAAALLPCFSAISLHLPGHLCEGPWSPVLGCPPPPQPNRNSLSSLLLAALGKPAGNSSFMARSWVQWACCSCSAL